MKIFGKKPSVFNKRPVVRILEKKLEFSEQIKRKADNMAEQLKNQVGTAVPALAAGVANLVSPAKNGFKTTEFWLTMLGNVAAIVGTVGGALPAEKAGIAVLISNGLYAISRGLAKR